MGAAPLPDFTAAQSGGGLNSAYDAAVPAVARIYLSSLYVFLVWSLFLFIIDTISVGIQATKTSQPMSSYVRSTKEAAVEFMQFHPLGRAWDALQGVLALFLAALFVLETYVAPDDPGTSGLGYFFAVESPRVEVAVATLFALDYLVVVYMADIRIIHAWSLPVLIDYVTFAPVLIAATMGLLGAAEYLQFVRFLRISRSFTILRTSVSKSVGKARRDDGPIRSIRLLAFTVLRLIFICTCVIHTIESTVGDGGVWLDMDGLVVHWHDAFYYTVVSMASVGYGDITPKSVLGRLVTVAAIVCAFTIVPVQVSAIMQLLSLRTPWRRAVALKRGQRHVIVCGVMDHDAAASFLAEFFHSEHGSSYAEPTKVVFLSPLPPSMETQSIIRSPFYEARVQYLTGSPLLFDDLLRVRAEDARACFLLANKHTTTPDEDDHATLLRAWAFKHYRADLPLYVQLLRSSNEGHVRACLSEGDCFYSLERMKMNLLAKSCLCPGFSTLLANLIRSDELRTDHLLLGQAAGAGRAPWKWEYCDGMGNEVYAVSAGPRYWGARFEEAAVDAFERYGLTLVALQHRFLDPAAEADARYRPGAVELNPLGQTINRRTTLFLLAQNPRAASQLERAAGPPLRPPLESSSEGAEPYEVEELDEEGAASKRGGAAPVEEPAASLREAWGGGNEELAAGGSGGSNRVVHVHYSAGGVGGGPPAVEVPEREQSPRAGPLSPSVRPSSGGAVRRGWLAQDRDRERVEGSRGAGRPYDTMQNLVVVCGCARGLHHFLRVLRDPRAARHRPVVLLDTVPPTAEEWFDMAEFLAKGRADPYAGADELRALCEAEEVFFAQGSPLVERDLERAGVRRADAVVVLSEYYHHNRPDAGVDDRQMVDAAAVMTIRLIESRLCSVRRPHTVASLNFSSNGAFLTLGRGYGALARRSSAALSAPLESAWAWTGRDRQLSPGRRANLAKASARLRRAKANASYVRSAWQGSFWAKWAAAARAFLTILSPRLMGPPLSEDDIVFGDDDAIQKQHLVKPHYCAGRLAWATMLDTFLHAAFYKPAVFAVVQRLVDPGERSQVALIDVEPGFAERPYSELFRRLVAQRRLPLALYRRWEAAPPEAAGRPAGVPRLATGAAAGGGPGAGEQGNPLPYVYTSPRPGTLVGRGDRVFVLMAVDDPLLPEALSPAPAPSSRTL